MIAKLPVKWASGSCVSAGPPVSGYNPAEREIKGGEYALISFLEKIFSGITPKRRFVHHELFLYKCAHIILSNIDDPSFTVDALAKKMGMSHSALYKKVKAVTDISVNEFVRRIRLEKASEMLAVGRHNINEAAYHSGFNDLKYFRKQFKKVYKMSPSAYRKKFLRPLQGEYLNLKVTGATVLDFYQFTP